MARMLKDEEIPPIAEYVSKMTQVKIKPTLAGNIENGSALYQTCSACHGAQAEGNKLLNAPPLVGIQDWYLVQQLKNYKYGYRAWDPELDPVGYAMVAISQMLESEQAMHDVAAYVATLGRVDS